MPSPLHPPHHHPNAPPRASGAKLKVPASLRRFDATDGNNSLGVDCSVDCSVASVEA